MSMHWEGYSEIGLVLNGTDLDTFKRKYLTIHPELISDDIEDMLNERDVFKYSDGSGKEFDTLYLTDDAIEGITLLPLSGGGWVLQDTPTVVIPAKLSNSTSGILKEGFYKSEEEIITEFKEKVGSYLPESFDYKSHIGDITYACFA